MKNKFMEEPNTQLSSYGKYTVNYNFNSVKVGETICYHIGCVAIDKNRMVPDLESETVVYHNESNNNEFEENNKVVRLFNSKADRPFTDEAIIVQNISNTAYKRSTAFDGTKEFQLSQQKIGFNQYIYLAKRLKHI